MAEFVHDVNVVRGIAFLVGYHFLVIRGGKPFRQNMKDINVLEIDGLLQHIGAVYLTGFEFIHEYRSRLWYEA